MPLRSKLIIYAVVMLLLFAGLSVGAFSSLSSASREAEAAREELSKLSLVEALQTQCAGVGPDVDLLACERALSALAELRDMEWHTAGKNHVSRILELTEPLKIGNPPSDPEALDRAVAELKREILSNVKGNLRSAERPAHRRATRLLVASCLLAVGGAGTFAWLYSRLVRERKALEERVQRSAKLAALGTLAAGVAHEINNPLATISMSAEAAADRLPADSDVSRYCLAIQEEAGRCRDIIGDLSDLARGGALDREPVDPEELVREAVRIVTRNDRLPTVTIEAKIPNGLPFISADRGKLLQVLVNLLQNAIEATGDDGKVHVAARQVGGRFSIAVTDNGRGIPTHLLDRIFEPFFTEKSRGVGLGLTLCHRIAEMHGGDLSVDSRGAGHGSTFSLSLPIEGNDDGA